MITIIVILSIAILIGIAAIIYYKNVVKPVNTEMDKELREFEKWVDTYNNF